MVIFFFYRERFFSISLSAPEAFFVKILQSFHLNCLTILENDKQRFSNNSRRSIWLIMLLTLLKLNISVENITPSFSFKDAYHLFNVIELRKVPIVRVYFRFLRFYLLVFLRLLKLFFSSKIIFPLKMSINIFFRFCQIKHNKINQ